MVSLAMALNTSRIVVSSKMTLKHHPARPPSPHTVQKIERGRGLALQWVSTAADRLSSVNALTFLHDKLLRDALGYHFGLERYDLRHCAPILFTLTKIAAGLEGRICFADVLGRTVWNPHDIKVVRKQTAIF